MAQRKGHLLYFEGLRGIAALTVVFYHLKLTLFADSTTSLGTFFAQLPWPVARFLRGMIESIYAGTLAVWVFWVMSGFVLTSQFFLLNRSCGKLAANHYLRSAALRRYPRLFVPVFASVMLAYVLHRFGFMANTDMALQVGSPDNWWIQSWYQFAPDFPNAVWSASWESFFRYRHESTYNGVLWTMEREFYGSLFVFGFLGLMGVRTARFYGYIIAAVGIFVMRLHWLNAFLVGILFCDVVTLQNPLATRLPAFSLRAFHLLRSNKQVAGVLWIGLLPFIGLPNYRGVFHLLVATAIVALTLLSVPTQRLLSSAASVLLGKISFGLYLVHQPVICSFTCWLYLRLTPALEPSWAVWICVIVTVLVSGTAGYLFQLIVDAPSILFSRRISSALLHRPPREHTAPACNTP